MTSNNYGEHTRFNEEPKIELNDLVHIKDERIESMPGLLEAEKAAQFLALNNLANTEAYRILNTGSSRINGGYEIALRGKQNAEEHKASAPIFDAQLKAMSEFDDVVDGNDLINRALQSLIDQEHVNNRLAQQIIEGCRDGNWPPESKVQAQPNSEI